MYIMLGTHPDVEFAVTKMAQQAGNPSQDHLNHALQFHPPPELLFLYGHLPSPNIGQYYAAGLGINISQLYYHAPPYPLPNQHGNRGYAPPGAFPDILVSCSAPVTS
jgi:hypothetical protein